MKQHFSKDLVYRFSTLRFAGCYPHNEIRDNGCKSNTSYSKKTINNLFYT
jgi:hypothetical protein